MARLRMRRDPGTVSPVIKNIAPGTDRDTVRSWGRRPIVLFGVSVAALGMLAVGLSPVGPGATAASYRVPVASVRLPSQVDWQAEYHAQTLCTPAAKPGTAKLGKLLDATYGKYIQYIARSCATPGVSEHEEGRALDWMVNSKVKSQRDKARAFLSWALAPGPRGEPAAMARRLGIMYLIYENKLWGVYRHSEGWRPYMGCSSAAKSSSSWDTTCHRDHIHMSLTWDGAYGTTSFWTGRAEARSPCVSSVAQRWNGSARRPKTLLDTNTGLGLAESQCRLAASTGYSSRSYQIKVPVPAHPRGVTPIQRIRVSNMDLDAPSALWISSATSRSLPRGTRTPRYLDVPLASNGIIRFTVGAGYTGLRVRAVGVRVPAVGSRARHKARATTAPQASPRPNPGGVSLPRGLSEPGLDLSEGIPVHP